MPSGIPELGVVGVRLKFLALLRPNGKRPGSECGQTGRPWLSQTKFKIWAKTDVKWWSKNWRQCFKYSAF